MCNSGNTKVENSDEDNNDSRFVDGSYEGPQVIGDGNSLLGGLEDEVRKEIEAEDAAKKPNP